MTSSIELSERLSSDNGTDKATESHSNPISSRPDAPKREPGKFVKAMRKVYSTLGFQKGYNFILFIIFGGAMLGFTLARLSYLNIGGSAPSSYKSGTPAGEWYTYREGHYRIGISLHLICIIPAGFLAVFQFIPIIRHKALLFHRLNGYIILLLSLLGNVGALMIARRAFGGGLDVQSCVGVLAIMTTTSLVLAYINIKRLQIDQHRAWMLRAWFYFSIIITARIIMIISATVITSQKNYSTTRRCGEIAFVVSGSSDLSNQPPSFNQRYPGCVNASEATPVAIGASMSGYAENVGVALGMSFGMAIWVAFWLHAVGVEIYLNATPREGERLRMVSYERQLERGFKNPGSAGLVVERWGDAKPWVPTVRESEK